jgi:DNA polymerase-3 subunit delta'
MLRWQRIIGHDWAVDLLDKSIQLGRISHAYLLTGPSQVGKATLANTFAQAINCLHPESGQRPCGKCRSCLLIAANHHPDVRRVTGQSSLRGTPSIKIDQIRELQQELNLSTAEARHKIAILEDFEQATMGAANAFLKTLEEPPSRVILLLTAADADMLLATIASRCQILNLKPLSTTLITEALQEHWRLSSEQAELFAHLAAGRIGWAVVAAQDPAILKDRHFQLSVLQDTLSQSRVGRFKMADQLNRKPENLLELFNTWITWWRDLSLLVTDESLSNIITNIDLQSKLRRLAQIWSAKEIIASLHGTEQALWQLKHNANTKLLIENLLLGYPYIREI